MVIGIALFVGQNSIIGSSNAMASILEKFPSIAGTANSMVGSVRFGISNGRFTSSVSEMKTATPMLFTMTACSIISVAFYYFFTYRNLK